MITIVLTLSVRILEWYTLGRIWNVPEGFGVGRLITVYLMAFFFPMIAVRDMIIKFVEIRWAKDNQSHVESALRSAYDGTGYWVNVCPKTRSAHLINRNEICLEATSWKKSILSYFQRPIVCVPPQCEVLTKIHKEDVPLLLKHKICISQSRITKDTSITTKTCFIIFTLYWAYVISKYTYCLWMFRYIPESYTAQFMFPPSIFIPLLYSSGKCIAPVFVTVESDPHSLHKDFNTIGTVSQVNEDIYLEKITDSKDSVRRKVLIWYQIEQALGSVLYLFLQFGAFYGTGRLLDFGVEGIFPEPPVPLSMIAAFLGINIEAIAHSTLCLIELGKAYFANRFILLLLFLLEKPWMLISIIAMGCIVLFE
ncbi:hypothetical protein K7432_001187 [Basidiobolus ranarum]|uniref:Uncharacterized protein n=1 Tax=Basidiobolus ranarum TaxID=34480 RepID=A0ABR2X3G9_9FUNG